MQPLLDDLLPFHWSLHQIEGKNCLSASDVKIR